MAHAIAIGATRSTMAASTPARMRPDATRILAQSGAIVAHVVAAMLLLTPMTQPLPVDPVEEMTVWLPPPLVQPPPPIPIQPVPPQTVTPPRRSPVARVPLPPVADSQPGDLPAVPDALPTDANPSFDPGPRVDAIPDLSPMTGASLAYADAPAPRYPPRAVREGRSGTVLLDITVGVDGTPVDVSIARSSGHRDLDQAALRQVLKHWRFQPAMRNGHAVVAIGRVPVDFKL